MKIKLNNLYKSYNKIVLEDVSLELEGYSSIAIIGPSGSGKSTLLRQLSMIEEVDSGEIFINDIKLEIENKRNFQKKIGFVFQNHNLFPHLTIERNISLILEKKFGKNKEEAKTIAIENLKMLGLEEFALKKPGNISGGQAQRASIARALSTDPNIIFLDEPTASLDPILKNDVLNSILELRKINRDFIIVTHEIEFVKKVSEYFIFLMDGKIEFHGSIDGLYNSENEKLNAFLRNHL